jgi:hypothetical protein
MTRTLLYVMVKPAHFRLLCALSMQTFMRLRISFMDLLPELNDVIVFCRDGLFSKQQLIWGVLQELSISLCRTSARLEQGVNEYRYIAISALWTLTTLLFPGILSRAYV